MAMTGVLRPVTALLLATAILMLRGGLQSVLLPLRAQFEADWHLRVRVLFRTARWLHVRAGCHCAGRAHSGICGFLRGRSNDTASARHRH